jgi:hypothetical protein
MLVKHVPGEAKKGLNPPVALNDETGVAFPVVFVMLSTSAGNDARRYHPDGVFGNVIEAGVTVSGPAVKFTPGEISEQLLNSGLALSSLHAKAVTRTEDAKAASTFGADTVAVATPAALVATLTARAPSCWHSLRAEMADPHTTKVKVVLGFPE